ncbi:response regulator receiver domain-containing protein [Geothermobacter ehrlichii]|uniref:Response regulator receiver domain-containing protein n=1 Tax=Geothermobacter ehrlichii TaxID=213224 RepID=A0A5D3WPJ5_9BACT|nr:response regulator [Geothermobacter ehrlichii]TYP00127.1 response regulator receiver domain-containing protein [Geothermobacter ehrlichii]
MSLVGNLEDLGLGDILQIVSLSRKSGVLRLRSHDREGTIVFFNGQVIRATSSQHRENLGHLLLQRGMVDADTLRQALTLQKRMADPPRLGVILAEHFQVDSELVEQAVKEQIEKVVYSFFSWNEGTFAFELCEPEEMTDAQAPLAYMLDKGLNPQWLAMEGSRILDERRHRGEDLEDVAAAEVADIDGLLGELAEEDTESSPVVEAAVGDAAARAEIPGTQLLLVDDDSLTRNLLAGELDRQGFRVETFADGRPFLEALEATRQRGGNPVLVIDLIMPRMDGSGILGGLELAEKIAAGGDVSSVLILTDHANPDAEKMLRNKGVPAVLRKPKKDELQSASGLDRLRELAEEIVLFTGKSPAGPAKSQHGLVDFGHELLEELGESPASRPEKREESPGLRLLKGMLQELNNPSLGGGIILLVLRFASELMNRAVIFLVRGDAIVGLGQFGLDNGVEAADQKVCRMRIPLDQPSVLTRALREMVPIKTAPGGEHWDRYLQDQLGGEAPQEIFLGPILSEGRAVALLYGDNLPERRPIGDTETLEIFLSQAGLAMEKALLERRLKMKESGEF